MKKSLPAVCFVYLWTVLVANQYIITRRMPNASNPWTNNDADYFRLPASLCGESKGATECSLMGGRKIGDCQCACNMTDDKGDTYKSTFGFYDEEWTCENTSSLRQNTGCLLVQYGDINETIPTIGKSYASFILKNRYDGDRCHEVNSERPHHNSSYQTCNGTWEFLNKTVLEQNFRIHWGLNRSGDINFQPHQSYPLPNGRLIRLVIECYYPRSVPSMCFLLKVEGNLKCPVPSAETTTLLPSTTAALPSSSNPPSSLRPTSSRTSATVIATTAPHYTTPALPTRSNPPSSLRPTSSWTSDTVITTTTRHYTTPALPTKSNPSSSLRPTSSWTSDTVIATATPHYTTPALPTSPNPPSSLRPTSSWTSDTVIATTTRHYTTPALPTSSNPPSSLRPTSSWTSDNVIATTAPHHTTPALPTKSNPPSSLRPTSSWTSDTVITTTTRHYTTPALPTKSNPPSSLRPTSSWTSDTVITRTRASRPGAANQSALIAGSVLGAVAFVTLAVITVIVMRRYLRKRRRNSNQRQQNPVKGDDISLELSSCRRESKEDDKVPAHIQAKKRRSNSNEERPPANLGEELEKALRSRFKKDGTDNPGYENIEGPNIPLSPISMQPTYDLPYEYGRRNKGFRPPPLKGSIERIYDEPHVTPKTLKPIYTLPNKEGMYQQLDPSSKREPSEYQKLGFKNETHA